MTRRVKNPRGVSLVEMLVAVLLSGVAITGLVSALLSARAALDSVRDRSEATANLAIGLDYVGRYVENAGYRHHSFSLDFDAIDFCDRESGCDGEFLWVAYQNTGEPDCAGVTSATAIQTARFAIRRNVAGDGLSLYCNDREVVEHIVDVDIRVAVADGHGGVRWIGDPAVLGDLAPDGLILLEATLHAAVADGGSARLPGIFRLMNLGALS